MRDTGCQTLLQKTLVDNRAFNFEVIELCAIKPCMHVPS